MKATSLKVLFLLTLMSFALCINSCNKQPSMKSASSEAEWLALSGAAQEKIVSEYVNALDSFALAMPIIGGDTESEWAADTAHAMAEHVRTKSQSFSKNMADIYQMQCYIAYGMSYFNAILGIYGDLSDLSTYTLRQLLPLCDSLHQSFVAKGCKDVKLLSWLKFTSIQNMQLFHTLNTMNNGGAFNERDFYYCSECEMYLDSISCMQRFSEKEYYKLSCFLESCAFFKMIIPIMRMLDGSSGLAKKNEPLIMEAAYFFDEATIPVYDILNKKEGTKILNDKEFEEYMLKATKYKIALLRIATQEMLDYQAKNQ